MIASGCLALIVTTFSVPGETKIYPGSYLLVEADALAAMKPDNNKLRILDARPKAEFAKKHIPGAVWIDAADWAKTFANDRTPESWEKKIGLLGAGLPHQQVIVYDANLSKDAARMWWILRYWGVRNARILNGGWGNWLATGGKTASRATLPHRSKPVLKAQENRLATKELITKWLKKDGVQILDVRSKGEHCGETETAKRNGTIPGAKHLEWSEAIDKKTGKFKSPEELRKLLKDAGINLDKPTTTFCQSGGRASVSAFVLELMGAKDVRNYYKSWKEWGNDKDTPVVKPKGK
jgi:thiosulfate/3-mercaptopyruvate sulfurtransferase